MKKVNVKQNEQEPVPIDVLAEAVLSISTGVKRLLAGPLKRDALVLLIQHASPSIGGRRTISRTEVNAVLEGITSLESAYLKPR